MPVSLTYEASSRFSPTLR